MAAAAVAPMEHGKHQLRRGEPADEAGWVELVAAMQAALGDDQQRAAVDAALRAGGEEGLTEAQLRRWLAARGFEPARAARDLAAHATWRAGFCPAGRVLEAEVANDLAQGKVLVPGVSARGQGVVVFVGKKHIPRHDQEEIQRFFCYTADAAIRLSPRGKVALVFMARGFGWANFDVAGLSMLFRMVHTHYVERMDVMYIHGPSTAFKMLYDVVYPFIDAATRQKVVVLPRDDKQAAAILERDLGPQVLPQMLGGAAEAKPIETVWGELLATQALAAE